MKILVYGINFAPDMTGIAKYTTEMCTWLVGQGHDVRVVTAPPYYPEWRVREGYSAWRHKTEVIDGVVVFRSPLWVPSQPGGIARLVHLLSFALLSIPTLLRQILWRPNVVWVVEPALACAPTALAASKLFGARSWLHVQDFEVDAAFKFDLLRGKLTERFVRAAERWLMRRFDRVSTISDRMLGLLREKGVDSQRTVLFPNWVDTQHVRPNLPKGSYRRELSIPDDAVVALYSGSMAAKQGLELLPAAARLLEHIDPRLVFVICGDGISKPLIEKHCEGLSNVRLLPLQASERLPEFLCTADIHLLPQVSDAADLVMPSKLTGMMSSGRPVVTTAREDTELGRVVTGRGLVVPPGDLQAFVAAILTLARDTELRNKMGVAARQYAEAHLARDQVLGRFNDALAECALPSRQMVRERSLSTAKATD